MVSIDKIEIKDTTIVNRQYTLISSNSACFTKVLRTYERVFSFLLMNHFGTYLYLRSSLVIMQNYFCLNDFRNEAFVRMIFLMNHFDTYTYIRISNLLGKSSYT